MSLEKESLSPETKKLIELAGDSSSNPNISVAEILKAHPELIVGLDEFIKWREENCAAVAKSDTAQGVGHGLKKALAKTTTKKTGK